MWLYFDYCSEVWGDTNKTLRDRLQKLQNKAVTEYNCDVQSKDILVDLDWGKL